MKLNRHLQDIREEIMQPFKMKPISKTIHIHWFIGEEKFMASIIMFNTVDHK